MEAAWAIVLAAFSQEEDVVFGSTVGGRFTDAVPLRARIRSEQPVLELVRELGAEYSKSIDGPAGDGIDLLSVIVREQPQIAVSLVFESERFEGEVIERMAGLLEEVLEAMAARPESTVGALPSLPARDVRTLAGFNDTRVPIPAFTSMHESFERQVDLTPDAIALVYRGQSLTYRELDRRANAVAGQLVALGVGPDAMVGIFIDRSVEMVVGLLAILKAGGAYVPMDPVYPSRRIAAMLEDTGARVVLTLDGLRSALPPTDAAIVAVDALGPERGTGRVGRRVEPHHLAYVIFTSGSTGRPKGVQIEHRHAANLFAGMDRTLGTTPGVWLALTSISFDISVVEIFWTLARGFTVVLQEWSERASGSHDAGTDYTTIAQIHRHSVTHLQCTPSLLGLLAIDDDAMAALSSLRVLVLGGEPIPTTLVDRLGPSFRGTWLNGYGPTETTVYSTVSVVRPGTPITIGRPVVNTQIHIVDRQLRPVPIGVRGEPTATLPRAMARTTPPAGRAASPARRSPTTR